MQIHSLKISQLCEATYNPRQITKREISVLKDSIKRFGLVDPIVVNKRTDTRYVIVGGHQRVRVMRELKHKEVPCVILELTDEQERELNIRLNQNGGRFDFDVLANDFDVADLIDWGFTEESLSIDFDGIQDQTKKPKDQSKCRDTAEEYALWMFHEARKKANNERQTHPSFDEWMDKQ